MRTPQELRERAEEIRDAFERERAKLYRDGGAARKQPLYSDEELGRRLSALRARRNADLAEVEGDVREAREAETAAIANLENRDPIGLLTSDELDRANAMRAYANDAAELLDEEGLAARLEAVLAAGEDASTFAYWMAGQRARDRILARRRRSLAASGDQGERPAARPAAELATATGLDDVLGRMHAALDRGRTASAIEAARGRLSELGEAERVAYLARHERDNVYSPRYSVPSAR